MLLHLNRRSSVWVAWSIGRMMLVTLRVGMIQAYTCPGELLTGILLGDDVLDDSEHLNMTLLLEGLQITLQLSGTAALYKQSTLDLHVHTITSWDES